MEEPTNTDDAAYTGKTKSLDTGVLRYLFVAGVLPYFGDVYYRRRSLHLDIQIEGSHLCARKKDLLLVVV
jgi:hypothetical protein